MAISGRVKWYNEKLGYGFIQRQDGEDVFVHFSALEDGEVLEEGETLQFEIVEGPKGPMAAQVVKAG